MVPGNILVHVSCCAVLCPHVTCAVLHTSRPDWTGMQEPDTAASAAQALISLVAAEERYFPLGFAYGHIRDAAVSSWMC